jgi:pyrroline-5-carboxylate reductase
MQTMQGAVAYARQSDRHVAELRNQVTSPGCTSAEALYHSPFADWHILVDNLRIA